MYHFLIKNKKVYKCIYSLTQISGKEISYTHSTGNFSHESSRGNEYLLLLHDFDSNEILVEPLTTKQAGEIAKAWIILHNKLTHSGHIIKHYIVDDYFTIISGITFLFNNVAICSDTIFVGSLYINPGIGGFFSFHI